MSKLTPTMIAGLNFIGKFGSVHGVRAATVKALISRELVWDEGDQWYLTSDAHNLDEVTDEAREADLARQEARNEQGADVDPDVADVAAVDQVITEELGDLAPTTQVLAKVGSVFEEVAHHMRETARKLGVTAWANQIALVRSMGHDVRGKVVDTVLRQPGPDGTGRVCLVVQHTQEAHTDRLGAVTWQPVTSKRHTLHALVDVKFEPATS